MTRVSHAAFGVHNDGVAFGHYGDGTSVEGFRRHVSDHEAVGGSAEATVGEQGYGIAESGANQGASDAEHFAHAGSAARTFVADDHHVVSLDPAFEHGRHGFLFTVENARRTVMDFLIVPGQFDDAAFGRERSAQNGDAAARLEGLGERPYDHLAGGFARVRGFLE